MAHMARHEVAVRANIAFHTRQPPFDVFNVTPEQVVIEFEGREFVWHPNLEPGPEGEEWWPGVTVVVNDHNDYEEERELMHRFLSFWNALDATFDNDKSRIEQFLDAEAPRHAGAFDYNPAPANWHRYLYDSNRNAIAHAVRRPGKPLLDPDLPHDRSRLYRDSRLLERLVRTAVEQRWPRPVRRKRGFQP